MAQPTDLHDQALPHQVDSRSESPGLSWGRKAKLAITHSVFWAYQRGSWQYDLIVIGILAFIFLSPRAWFNDRPTLQLSDLRHQQGIIELSRVNKNVFYLVDARLVDSIGLK